MTFFKLISTDLDKFELILTNVIKFQLIFDF